MMNDIFGQESSSSFFNTSIDIHEKICAQCMLSNYLVLMFNIFKRFFSATLSFKLKAEHFKSEFSFQVLNSSE